MNTTMIALLSAAHFHRLASVAAKNGALWVSHGGGTANVAAGELSRATGVDYEEAHRFIDQTGLEFYGPASPEEREDETGEFMKQWDWDDFTSTATVPYWHDNRTWYVRLAELCPGGISQSPDLDEGWDEPVRFEAGLVARAAVRAAKLQLQAQDAAVKAAAPKLQGALAEAFAKLHAA